MKHIAYLGDTPPFPTEKYDTYDGFEIPSADGSPLLRFWVRNPRLEVEEDGFVIVVDDYLLDSGEIIEDYSAEDNLIDAHYEDIEHTLLDQLRR